MNIAPGTRLGPYEISARIGAGGMGEVWAARDTRLRRDVAIKVLPDLFASDPDRLQRFDLEARAAGAISHPNLVTIYDVGSDNGTAYVVMELLEGETLREKLGDAVHDHSAARLPIRKAVDYSVQIAHGLAAAHEKHIIHRDLKPENLFVTRDGRVKILDFGLAKLSLREHSADDATEQKGTAPGMVLGTAGYMSPEQVRGRQVDHRTDIFSFGAVLYEMLAGRRAFQRDSSIETMNSILKDDPPDMQEGKSLVSPGLELIVRRCLEKTPEERFQSAHDLAFALAAVTSTSSHPAMESVERKWPARIVPALVVAAIVLAATVGIVELRMRTAARTGAPVTRTFTQLTYQSDESFPSIAPDGKTFAFVSSAAGKQDIYVQRIDGRKAINLTGDSPAANYQPAFSPDGSEIAFRSDRDGGGIFIIGATGESVRRLSDFGYNPAWSPDGREIAVGTDTISENPRDRPLRSALWVIDVRSGAKRRLIEKDGVQPSWSPHGHRIAYWGLVGDTGQRDLWTIDPHAADPPKSITHVTDDAALDWSPVWAPDGKSLYFGSDRDGTLNLWRAPMDEGSGKPTGEATQVTLPARFAAHFGVARTGDLIFAAIDTTETCWSIPFDPVSMRPTGEATDLFRGGLVTFAAPEASPDGQWWTFSNSGRQEDIYIIARDGSGLRQLTNDPEKDRAPAFSADGGLIYFYSQRGAHYEIWSVRPDGGDLRQVSKLAGAGDWYPRPFPGHNALLTFDEKGPAVLPFDRDGTITRKELLPALPNGTRMRQPVATYDGSILTGSVRSAVQGTGGVWTYSFVTRQYEHIADNVWVPRWVPGSKEKLLALRGDKVIAIDVKTKQTHDLPLPVRNIYVFSTSPDGRTLIAEERSRSSVIWLMKSKTE